MHKTSFVFIWAFWSENYFASIDRSVCGRRFERVIWSWQTIIISCWWKCTFNWTFTSFSLSLPLYTSFLSLSSFCFKIHLYFLTLSLTYTLCFSLLSLHFLSLSLFLQYALIALSLSFSLSFNHSISCLLFTLFTILTFSHALIYLSCTLCYLIILFLSLRQMNFLPLFSTLTQKEGEVFIWNFGFRG